LIQLQNSSGIKINHPWQFLRILGSSKVDEVLHNLQQSWVAFQEEIRNRIFEQQAQQYKINGRVNELITGLSQQVLQMTNQFQEEGNQNSP